MPHGAFSIGPFAMTDFEQYEGRVIILYTDGDQGTFPASGSGFIYVPNGGKIPAYNQGSDGHLFGDWYWFTTD
jgi:hypothetical protein